MGLNKSLLADPATFFFKSHTSYASQLSISEDFNQPSLQCINSVVPLTSIGLQEGVFSFDERDTRNAYSILGQLSTAQSML